MNKWLSTLIILGGLGTAGYYEREPITAFLQQHGYGNSVSAIVPATPHPAKEATEKAKKAYPALGIAGSPFNIKFIALYNSTKDSDPNFLAQPDWPLLLAQRTATELGGGAMPVPGKTSDLGPASFQPNQLDNKPKKPTSTVPPSVQLPGLTGSSLDQRPVSGHH